MKHMELHLITNPRGYAVSPELENVSARIPRNLFQSGFSSTEAKALDHNFPKMGERKFLYLRVIFFRIRRPSTESRRLQMHDLSASGTIAWIRPPVACFGGGSSAQIRLPIQSASACSTTSAISVQRLDLSPSSSQYAQICPLLPPVALVVNRVETPSSSASVTGSLRPTARLQLEASMSACPFDRSVFARSSAVRFRHQHRPIGVVHRSSIPETHQQAPTRSNQKPIRSARPRPDLPRQRHLTTGSQPPVACRRQLPACPRLSPFVGHGPLPALTAVQWIFLWGGRWSTGWGAPAVHEIRCTLRQFFGYSSGARYLVHPQQTISFGTLSFVDISSGPHIRQSVDDISSGPYIKPSVNNISSGPHISQSVVDISSGLHINQSVDDISSGPHISPSVNNISSGPHISQSVVDISSGLQISQSVNDISSGPYISQSVGGIRSGPYIRQSAVGLIPHPSISSWPRPTSVNQQWASSHICQSAVGSTSVSQSMTSVVDPKSVSQAPLGCSVASGRICYLSTLAALHSGGARISVRGCGCSHQFTFH
ncbi:hypothetical protein ACLOJK_002992 [Asimina triloba]